MDFLNPKIRIGRLDSKLENAKNCIDFHYKCVMVTQYKL